MNTKVVQRLNVKLRESTSGDRRSLDEIAHSSERSKPRISLRDPEPDTGTEELNEIVNDIEGSGVSDHKVVYYKDSPIGTVIRLDNGKTLVSTTEYVKWSAEQLGMSDVDIKDVLDAYKSSVKITSRSRAIRTSIMCPPDLIDGEFVAG